MVSAPSWSHARVFDSGKLRTTMRLPALLAALFVSLTFAGCTGPPETPALETIYDETEGNATSLVILGAHLEGRIGEGPWGASAEYFVEGGNVDTPPMTAGSALGGGGETTALEMPQNVTATVHVRILESERLTGYMARYYLERGGDLDLPDANRTPTATVPVESEFTAELSGPGAFVVGVVLYDGDAVVAVYDEAFEGRLAVHWAATGQVQPQKPAGQLPTWPTAREEMTDIYTIALPSGVTLTATTAPGAGGAPTDGPDVDLGLHGPDGMGVVCSAGPDANETVSTETTEEGSWTVQVGAMEDGCGGTTGYQYQNQGPVSYTLDITVG